MISSKSQSRLTGSPQSRLTGSSQSRLTGPSQSRLTGSSLDVLFRLSSSTFISWCETEQEGFRTVSYWMDRSSNRGLVSTHSCLLAKQLLNNTLAISDLPHSKHLQEEYAISYLYLADTVRSLEVLGIDKWVKTSRNISLKLLSETVVDVLTILEGKIMLFTPLDWLISIIQRDSTISEQEEKECAALFLFLSTHPSYYKIEADKLAAAGVFYCRLASRSNVETGLVLEKKGYRFTFSDSLPIVEIIHSMIKQLLPYAPEPEAYDPAPLHANLPSLEVSVLELQDPILIERRACEAQPRPKRTQSPAIRLMKDRSLGSGIAGQVYKARSGNNPIAIKSQKRTEDSIRELAIMCTVSNANVQSARSFSFEGDRILIHMTAQPHSLANLIYKSHTYEQGLEAHDNTWMLGKPSPFKLIDLITRRNFTRQLLQGLIHLGDIRIIHGDIKPSNLLISQSGVLKVADFGLAIAYADNLQSAKKTSIIVYAPAYRDPNVDERIKKFSFEADIWAAAVTILEMEVGILPVLKRKISFVCIEDHSLASVCSQMLIDNIYDRVTARQALVVFE